MSLTQCRLHNKYDEKEKPDHRCLVCNMGYLTSYPTLDPGTDYSMEELKELKEDITVMTSIGRSALMYIIREIKMRTNPSKSPVYQDMDYGDPTDPDIDDGYAWENTSFDPL